jgi:hypothetical protein
MGLIKLFSGSDSPLPNPNPKNFRVVSVEHNRSKTVTLVRVVYPDATTFGGGKLLLLGGYFTFSEIEQWKELDPHFLESNNVIARFRPTHIALALRLLESLK